MKLYLISSAPLVLEHWGSALKKYNPVRLNSIRELENSMQGIIFCLDSDLSDIELPKIIEQYGFKLMILSMLPNFTEAQGYVNQRVVGYGNAMMHESHIQSAYQAIEEGKVWLYPDFISSMIEQLSQLKTKSPETNPSLDKLSSREKEVALCLAHGLTHHEIADELNITVRTIKAHCSSIYEKLSVKDRLSLSVLLHS